MNACKPGLPNTGDRPQSGVSRHGKRRPGVEHALLSPSDGQKEKPGTARDVKVGRFNGLGSVFSITTLTSSSSSHIRLVVTMVGMSGIVTEPTDSFRPSSSDSIVILGILKVGGLLDRCKFSCSNWAVWLFCSSTAARYQTN